MVNPIVGLRGRTVSKRVDEGSDWPLNKGEPSRKVFVQTSLTLQGVQVHPSIEGQFDYSVGLDLKERDGQSGENQIPEDPSLVLQIPIQGKEVALVSGLIGRTFKLFGTVPEKYWTYDQLQQAYLELKDRYENLVYQLDEARSSVETTPQKVYYLGQSS